MRLLRLILLTGTILPGLVAMGPGGVAADDTHLHFAQGGPEERGPRGGGPRPEGPHPESPHPEGARPAGPPPAARERPEPRPERAPPPAAPREQPAPREQRAPAERPEPRERPAPPQRPEPREERAPARRQPPRPEPEAPPRERPPERRPETPSVRPPTPERQQAPERSAPERRPTSERDERPTPTPAPPPLAPPPPAPPAAAPRQPAAQSQRAPNPERGVPDAERGPPANGQGRPQQRPEQAPAIAAPPPPSAAPNTDPGIPGRPVRRRDSEPDTRPRPNAVPGAEPGRPVAPNTPPNLAPGVPGRPVQSPAQAPGPGPAQAPPPIAPGLGRPVPIPGDAPVPPGDRGGLNAPGRPGAVPGGFRQDDDVRDYEQVRRERRESSEGGRTYYREPGRIIVRDRDTYFIRHDENERFRDLDRSGYRSERRGPDTYSTIDRPGGEQIVTVTDDDGRLLRRYRRFRDGREVVIIDNAYGGGPPRPIYEDVVVLPAPQIRIPRERYVVEYQGADEGAIYEALTAPPVVALDRRYTLDQVRYSPDLRARMRSVDIDTINFETGSFQVTPDQAQRLSAIATAIDRAIRANPQEVFLIEGYTDAVGSDIDNLSLSDRRAQSVATVLTRTFNVPPENLTTQGYGEQYLKVNTQAPSRENRRVTVRRITPLLQQGQAASSR